MRGGENPNEWQIIYIFCSHPSLFILCMRDNAEWHCPNCRLVRAYDTNTDVGLLSNIQRRGEKGDIEVEKEVIWIYRRYVHHRPLPTSTLFAQSPQMDKRRCAKATFGSCFRSLRMGELRRMVAKAGKLPPGCCLFALLVANCPHIIILQANTIKTFFAPIRSVE